MLIRRTRAATALAHTRGKKKKAATALANASSSGDVDVHVDLSRYRDSMGKTVDNLQRDLSAMRTSGAQPNLLDSTFTYIFFLETTRDYSRASTTSLRSRCGIA
jgi:hypothetical protein